MTYIKNSGDVEIYTEIMYFTLTAVFELMALKKKKKHIPLITNFITHSEPVFKGL